MTSRADLKTSPQIRFLNVFAGLPTARALRLRVRGCRRITCNATVSGDPAFALSSASVLSPDVDAFRSKMCWCVAEGAIQVAGPQIGGAGRNDALNKIQLHATNLAGLTAIGDGVEAASTQFEHVIAGLGTHGVPFTLTVQARSAVRLDVAMTL